MRSITVLLLSVALAMDAFAVSISCGISEANSDKTAMQTALKAGIAFGAFQAGMTWIGAFLGESFSWFIEPVDHWIALILLSVIGINMIKESREETCEVILLTNIKVLITLSIATSIDALAAGLSITTMNVGILIPVASIGSITFIMSMIGVFIGKEIGCNIKLKSSVDIIGGLILIGIGVKVFIEHMFF